MGIGRDLRSAWALHQKSKSKLPAGRPGVLHLRGKCKTPPNNSYPRVENQSTLADWQGTYDAQANLALLRLEYSHISGDRTAKVVTLLLAETDVNDLRECMDLLLRHFP